VLEEPALEEGRPARVAQGCEELEVLLREPVGEEVVTRPEPRRDREAA
jgi:hypothetical protein